MNGLSVRPSPPASAAPAVRASVPTLSAIGMHKRFGAVAALADVSFTLKAGTFHALLGENGAGKSTLVKCIMGYYRADAGRISLGDTDVQIASPRDAQDLGIGMVYQHFTLVPNMSVAENLVLARAHLPAVIDWRREQEALRAFMAKMPFQIDPARIVRSLSAGERQKLEILKQLYLGNRILILDEPTSVLTPVEADEVLRMLREMAERGALSVLMISHKFREVTTFADEVTVLRRGRWAGHGAVADLTPSDMAAMMIGGEPPKGSATRGDATAGPARLELRGVSALDDRGVRVLDDVTLEVRAGEIVGIAGVSGNGQEQLLEIIAGQRELSAGQIQVDGAGYDRTRSEARTRGVRCLPEEPLRNACVPTMTVAENLGFRVFDRPPFTLGTWLVRAGAMRRHAASCVTAYRVRTASVDAPMAALSGGNVQRVVLARELDGTPRVLVVANPCFGLDFSAVAEIRTRIMEARNSGVAVLLISTDLDEVFALSDRILVMSAGTIAYATPVADADIAVIGKHMAGHGG